MLYAIIETGEYEGNHICIYKINKSDKDKFINFCKDSEGLSYCESEDIRLILFCENVELIKNRYLSYKVETTKTLLKELKEAYDSIFEFKTHWVNSSEEKDLIISTYEKLLSYEFLEVE